MGSPRRPFEGGRVYHIYNHAVGTDNLFREEENYLFFLRKFSSRILSFADIYSFCLMPNHFHFALRVKEHNELLILWQEQLNRRRTRYQNSKTQPLNDAILIDHLIIHEFASLFNSYAQAYNRKYSRSGSLFKESFQRKIIKTENYLLKLICYVHNNPVEHGFAARKEDWKYSSYNAILSNRKTNVQKEEVLKLFGGRENFIFVHNQNTGVEL